MAIRNSSAQTIQALIADLGAGNDVRRESAVARLAVMGPRAVDRLLGTLQSGPSPEARAGALRALEAIHDPRSLKPSLATVDDANVAVALAAINLGRSFLADDPGSTSVDALTRVALDAHRPAQVRLAAIEALGDLPSKTTRPLWERLQQDPSPEVRTRVLQTEPGPRQNALMRLEEASRHVPDDPGEIRSLVVEVGRSAPLSTLHRLVDLLRSRERAESDPARQPHWAAARAAVHQALASQGSRLALYDLRETLEEGDAPAPVELLAALSAVGDASCLESIAAAYERTAGEGRGDAGQGHDWWRDHLADAFRAITTREHITRRHPAVRRLQARSPQLVDELLQGGRATRARGARSTPPPPLLTQ